MKHPFTKISAENPLQGYPGWYILALGDLGRFHQNYRRKEALFMSDGGSRLREQQTDTDSEEPPSVTSSWL
jgi:hypothetical protein